MEQIITGLIKNKPGVLATISDTFRDLDINITSLVVAETVDESISYITIVTDTTENKIDTIKDKLSSVMDIEKLEQLGREDHYERELLLVQVAMNQEDVSRIMQIAELFHAHVIGVGKHSITLEFVGETEQVKGFIRMMTPFGIKALARTGRTAVKKET